METSTMIRQLRRTAKKHENDKLHTFDTNINQMCTDVANRLEELEKENKEIRSKTIDEFVERIKEVYPFTILELEQLDELAEEMRGVKNEAN